MPNSVLEAIKLGVWDYEPRERDCASFEATRALPGTADKLQILAQRAQSGYPLWHPLDRRDFEESTDG